MKCEGVRRLVALKIKQQGQEEIGDTVVKDKILVPQSAALGKHGHAEEEVHMDEVMEVCVDDEEHSKVDVCNMFGMHSIAEDVIEQAIHHKAQLQS